MLSKKRVRTKLNTRTKSKRITKSRKLNKKRVKRVSTKQRGGVKRRRTKKSKKKSQKGGSAFAIAKKKLDLKIQIDELPYAQRKPLLDMLEKSPEQVEQIIKQIQEGKSFEEAVAEVEASQQGNTLHNTVKEAVEVRATVLTNESPDLVTHVFFKLFGFNIDMGKLDEAINLTFSNIDSEIDVSLLERVHEAIKTYSEKYYDILEQLRANSSLNKEKAQDKFKEKTGVIDEKLTEFYYSEESANNMPINLAGLTSFEGFPKTIKDIKKGLHTKIKELLENCDCNYQDEDESAKICEEAMDYKYKDQDGEEKTGIPTFYALFFYKLLQQGVITKISAGPQP